MTNKTKDIYDKNAFLWNRETPNSLSDFTGRPPVFELCGNVSGKKLLDLGCGEGYCSRYLEILGASHIEAIDISDEMIALAKSKIKKDTVINFKVGDIKKLPYDNNSFDLVLGMFVYNYLDKKDMLTSLKEVFRVLKKSGFFIFAVPHPFFPLLKKNNNPPFYFDFENDNYFSRKNKISSGKIFCLDGKALPVQMIHKTFEDFFEVISDAGFENLPTLKELTVLDMHIQNNHNFFNTVYGLPLHLAFKLEK